jgi:hypothetical protein
MRYGRDFVLTLFSNDPVLAARADRALVDRIGIDLDRLGKHERQGPQYRISDHEPQDLIPLRAAVGRAKLFARTDPLHDGSQEQIDRLLELGAQVLMLPLFFHQDEAARFVDMVRGRALVSLLVETVAAAVRIHEIVRLGGVDEVFVGLNDLQLSLKLQSRFEVLAGSTVVAAYDRVFAPAFESQAFMAQAADQR